MLVPVVVDFVVVVAFVVVVVDFVVVVVVVVVAAVVVVAFAAAVVINSAGVRLELVLLFEHGALPLLFSLVFALWPYSQGIHRLSYLLPFAVL